MWENCFDRFKSDHFGFVLYKNTLRIHFWWLLEAKSMVLWRFLTIFDKNVKNRCRLYGSTRNFMIRSTVMVKNCIDVIFEGLRDIWISVFLAVLPRTCVNFPESCKDKISNYSIRGVWGSGGPSLDHWKK